MTSEILPRVWHLCPTEPTTRIPAPPAQDLFLGAIIRSKRLDHLRSPLNRTERPNIPLDWVKEAGPQTTSHRVKEARTGSVGFFTTIAQLIGFGPQLDLNWANNSDVRYRFEEERDMWLNVPIEERSKEIQDTASASIRLCEDAVTASSNVQKFLQESGMRKPVYMVTGIKWVQGIRMMVLSGHQVGGEGTMEVDLTAVTGVPVQVGVRGGGSREHEETHSAQGGASFIFCIRLTKLQWDRMGNLSTEDVRKAAYMSVDKGQGAQQPETVPVLTTRDAHARDFEDGEAISLVDVSTGLQDEFVYDFDPEL